MSLPAHGFMSLAFGDMEKEAKRAADIMKAQMTAAAKKVSAAAKRAAIETKKHMTIVTNKYKSVGKTIGTAVANPFKFAFNNISKMGTKVLGKVFGKKTRKNVQRFGKNLKAMGGAMMGPIAGLMSFMQSLEIFEPLIDVIQGLMDIFAGAMMEALMPAFMKLFEVLLSPEVIDLIKMLAGLFASILIPIIEVFAEVLIDLMPIFKILIDVIKSFMPIIKIVAKLFAEGLGFALKLVANIIITVYNAIAFVINAIIGILNFFGAGIPSLPILPWVSMQQGGITTGTTMALLHANEKVIPLKEEREQNKSQELLWATEDNGKKLDELIIITYNKQRLR